MTHHDTSFQRLEAAFHAATDLAGPGREATLRDLDSSDPELALELRELLAAHDAEDPAAFSKPPAHRTRVGRYELLAIRGSGASGCVYEALADDATNPVALKLYHDDEARAADGDDSRAREIESLRRIAHPGIARVLDHGVASSGKRFLVTELARGSTLSVWVRNSTPSLADRLAVIEQVARAIHAAHECGVVHRDLKPSNVIVESLPDRSLRTKVVDFGIARLTPNGSFGSLATAGATGRLLGTLAYMSPEQTHDARSADARSDVYSLGAMLHELLTGGLPHRIDDAPLDRVLHRIRATLPRRVDELEPSLPATFGDVVRQALATDPRDRYSSARAFADDLANLRDGRPVGARPLSIVERFARGVARSPRLVAATIAFLVVGFGTALAIERLASRARVADARALAATETEREIREFFAEAVHGANANWTASEPPTLRAFTDAAADALDQRFPDRPTARSAFSALLSDLYLSLGVGERALSLAAATLTEREARLGLDHRETIEAAVLVARSRYMLGDHLGAAPLFTRAVEWYRRHAPSETKPLVAALGLLNKIDINRGDYENATRRATEIEALLVASGENLGETGLHATLDAADLLRRRGLLDEAEEKCRAVAAEFRARHGESHEGALNSRIVLGEIALQRKDATAALAEFAAAFECAAAANGRQDPWVGSMLARVATAEAALGRFTEAEAHFLEALETLTTSFGRSNRNVAGIRYELARLRFVAGDFDAALAHLDAMRAAYEVIFTASHPEFAPVLEARARILCKMGRLDDAIDALDEAARCLGSDPARAEYRARIESARTEIETLASTSADSSAEKKQNP